MVILSRSVCSSSDQIFYGLRIYARTDSVLKKNTAARLRSAILCPQPPNERRQRKGATKIIFFSGFLRTGRSLACAGLYAEGNFSADGAAREVVYPHSFGRTFVGVEYGTGSGQRSFSKPQPILIETCQVVLPLQVGSKFILLP